MEEETKPLREGEKPNYVPRPAWQVWGERVGLAVFLLLVISQLIAMMTGGGA